MKMKKCVPAWVRRVCWWGWCRCWRPWSWGWRSQRAGLKKYALIIFNRAHEYGKNPPIPNLRNNHILYPRCYILYVWRISFPRIFHRIFFAGVKRNPQKLKSASGISNRSIFSREGKKVEQHRVCTDWVTSEYSSLTLAICGEWVRLANGFD